MVNTTAAIMALPAPLEKIRLVGDEDKHATLLYFGETSTLPDGAKQVLTDAVKMAAGMLYPFREAVVDVTRLGTENPPALVAMLSGDNLTQVRNLFMMNPEVKGYLDNTTQFSSFTPHMTLGYPDFVDEAVLRTLMRQVYGVGFDRLAVWWNDERIEFPLQGPVSDTQDMVQSIKEFLEHYGEEDSDHLEHHGIKGMKWGVRRPVNASTGLVTRTDHTVKVNLKTGKQKVMGGDRAERKALQKHLNEGGQLVLPNGGHPKEGLKPRTSSADQIAQDRTLKKVKSNGIDSLSNTEIQAFTRRLQLEQDLSRALAQQSAAEKAKADGFIKTFIKKQGSRQFDRVANKAIDIAVEQAISKAGVKVGNKNPDLGKNLGELSKRLKPKKG